MYINTCISISSPWLFPSNIFADDLSSSWFWFPAPRQQRCLISNPEHQQQDDTSEVGTEATLSQLHLAPGTKPVLWWRAVVMWSWFWPILSAQHQIALSCFGINNLKIHSLWFGIQTWRQGTEGLSPDPLLLILHFHQFVLAMHLPISLKYTRVLKVKHI